MHPFYTLILTSLSLYGLTLSLVLFTKKAELKKANVFLGLLLLIFSTILLQAAIAKIPELQLPFKFQIIIASIWYLIPPLIYLHADYTLHPSKKFSKWDSLHLIPVLLHIINILPFFLFLDASQQTDWGNAGRVRNNFLYQMMDNAKVLLIQYLIYIPLSFFKINQFLKVKRDKIVLDSRHRVVFLRNAYLCLTLFIVLMEIFRMLKIPGTWGVIFLSGIIFTLFFLAYVTLYNPAYIFNRLKYYPILGQQELSAAENLKYKNTLSEAMQKGAFKNPQLTLHQLAESIHLQPRQLSKLIKTQYHMGFSEFINTQRVEATKEMLVDDKYANWTILAIGLEVGFNSKTTFNRVFKSKTGLTPSQYMLQSQKS
ncbi:MAG: helix-turn-helix transcriptional regulator [Bacteroidota bacterium]